MARPPPRVPLGRVGPVQEVPDQSGDEVLAPVLRDVPDALRDHVVTESVGGVHVVRERVEVVGAVLRVGPRGHLIRRPVRDCLKPAPAGPRELIVRVLAEVVRAARDVPPRQAEPAAAAHVPALRVGVGANVRRTRAWISSRPRDARAEDPPAVREGEIMPEEPSPLVRAPPRDRAPGGRGHRPAAGPGRRHRSRGRTAAGRAARSTRGGARGGWQAAGARREPPGRRR